MARDERSYDRLIEELRAFRDARGWSPFHTPKELAIAVSTEAGELLECFLWSESKDPATQPADSGEAIRSEVADVAIFLLYLCDALGVDLVETVWEKHRINAARLPVQESHGRARRPRRA